MSKGAGKGTNPFIVSTVVTLAVFLEVLDTTVANVSLAHIAGALGATAEESTWVLTSYLISNGIVLPLSGWLSARWGRKRFFLFCIAGFTIASFLCGMATSLPMLIGCRLLQGVAGGGLQPSQQAIIKDSFPPEKLGMAFAVAGITTVLAPILGPLIGGYITDNYSWRWIFLMNVPMGIIAAAGVYFLLEDTEGATKREVGGVDWPGLGLVVIGLGAMQIVLDKGQQEDWFDSSLIVSATGVSVVALMLLTRRMLCRDNPLIDLKLLMIPSFATACVMLFFVGFVLYSSNMLLPMLAQGTLGYDATGAGLVLSPGAVVVIFLMPLIGKLLKWVQARYLISIGLLLSAFGAGASMMITPQIDFNTLVMLRIVQSIGLPFLFIPVNTLAFSKIAAEQSSNAAAIASLIGNIGASVGISVITNQLIHNQQIEYAQLTKHIHAGAIGYQNAMNMQVQTIANVGVPIFDATHIAMAKIHQEVLLQSNILAFCDTYGFVAVLMMVLTIPALLMPHDK